VKGEHEFGVTRGVRENQEIRVLKSKEELLGVLQS